MLNHGNQKWRSEEKKQKPLTQCSNNCILPTSLLEGNKNKSLAQTGFQPAEFVSLYLRARGDTSISALGVKWVFYWSLKAWLKFPRQSADHSPLI